MRDDVKILLASLQELYETKLSLLENLHRETATKLYYCKTGNFNRLSDTVESDTIIRERIDILDFNITRIRTELSRVMGIRPLSLIPILTMGIHPMYRTLLDTIKKLTSVLESYAHDHEELLTLMEKKKEEIEKAHRSLISHLRISHLCRKHTD